MKPVRAGLFAALGLLALTLAGGIWYLGPSGRELRLSRANLVTLSQETEQHPEDGLAWYYLGTRLRAKGAGEEALDALRRAQQLRPDDGRVRVELGWAHLDQNQVEEAFQLAKSATGRDPQSVEAKALLARVYQRTGAYHKAEAEWQSVLKTAPNHGRAWYFLAFCYLQMQKVKEAVAAADRAVQLEPNKASYLRLRGSIAAAGGDLAGAKQFYARAIEKDPADARSYHDFVNYLLTQKPAAADLPEIERALSRLRELEPNHPLFPWHEARIAVIRGEWASAVRLLEQVVQSTPGLTEAHFQLANAYYRTGKRPEGDREMATYRRRSELNRRIDELRIRAQEREEPRLLFQLAALQREAGLLDEAERSVRAGLQLDPKSPEGLREARIIESAMGRATP